MSTTGCWARTAPLASVRTAGTTTKCYGARPKAVVARPTRNVFAPSSALATSVRVNTCASIRMFVCVHDQLRDSAQYYL